MNKNDPWSLDASCHHLFYGVSENHKISEKLLYTSSELNYESNFKLGTMALLQFTAVKKIKLKVCVWGGGGGGGGSLNAPDVLLSDCMQPATFTYLSRGIQHSQDPPNWSLPSCDRQDGYYSNGLVAWRFTGFIRGPRSKPNTPR